MIVYFAPKKYDLNVIPTEAIPARRLAIRQDSISVWVPDGEKFMHNKKGGVPFALGIPIAVIIIASIAPGAIGSN